MTNTFHHLARLYTPIIRGALAISVLIGIAPLSPVVAASAPDVTSQAITYPAVYNHSSPYVRNLWDMQVYQNKIYLGVGNGSNTGPGLRPGPIPIMSFDPKTDKGINEFMTNEDMVRTYQFIDGVLTVPGEDPRDGHDKGNYYQLINNQWVKKRTIPNGVHNYDMTSFQGKLFAAIGSGDLKYQTASLMQSADNGVTWKPAALNPPHPLRSYNVFVFKNELYAAAPIYPKSEFFSTIKQVLKYDGNYFVPMKDVNMGTLFPGLKTEFGSAKMYRVTPTPNRIYYIASSIADTYLTTPQALYTATTMGTGQLASLPDAANAKPHDIITRNTTTYVLTAAKQANGLYINAVYATNNTNEWREVFTLRASTLARSFEEIDGDFYLGLGSEQEPLSPDAGKIIKVPKTAYGLPASSVAPTTTPVTTLTPTPTPTVPPTTYDPADLNRDGVVGVQDLSYLLARWGTDDLSADINKDAKIDVLDLSQLLSKWSSVTP